MIKINMIRNRTKPVRVIGRKVFYVLIVIALVALVLMAKANAAETKPSAGVVVVQKKLAKLQKGIKKLEAQTADNEKRLAALKEKAGMTSKPEEKKEDIPAPTLTAEEKLQVREFQLKDSRLLNEVQKRQAEIVQLQAAGQENIQSFNVYIKGVCKPVGDKKFDLDLNVLNCTAQK